MTAISRWINHEEIYEKSEKYIVLKFVKFGLFVIKPCNIFVCSCIRPYLRRRHHFVSDIPLYFNRICSRDTDRCYPFVTGFKTCKKPKMKEKWESPAHVNELGKIAHWLQERMKSHTNQWRALHVMLSTEWSLHKDMYFWTTLGCFLEMVHRI